MWVVYIIEAEDESLYTGITKDVKSRFHKHLNKKGAKYFYARRPVCVCYTETVANRSLASKREVEIKAFSREKKLQLVKQWLKKSPTIII